MQLTDGFKQTNEGAAITRTGVLTQREAVTGKCARTQELSPYRIRSLQGSASTSSTPWTMVIMATILAASAVAFVAKMGGTMKNKLERKVCRRRQ